MFYLMFQMLFTDNEIRKITSRSERWTGYKWQTFKCFNWFRRKPGLTLILRMSNIKLLLIFSVSVLCFLFCLSSSCDLCAQCCQYIWVVHSGLPLRFSLTFIPLVTTRSIPSPIYCEPRIHPRFADWLK